MRVRSITLMVLAAGLVVATGCGSEDEAGSGLAAFKACGGFLTGTWQVVDSDMDSAAAAAAANASLKPVCKDTFQSATFDARGATVTYVQSTANTPGVALYSRTATGGISATQKLLVSAACALDQFDSTDCAAVAAALKLDGAAECGAGTAPCACTVTIVDTADAPDTVTAQGVQYTTEEGDVFEFCQQGDTMEQGKRDSTGKLVSWMKLSRK